MKWHTIKATAEVEIEMEVYAGDEASARAMVQNNIAATMWLVDVDQSEFSVIEDSISEFEINSVYEAEA